MSKNTFSLKDNITNTAVEHENIKTRTAWLMTTYVTEENYSIWTTEFTQEQPNYRNGVLVSSLLNMMSLSAVVYRSN
jgi:hypothetical protein